MIIDLEKFALQERPIWDELERKLEVLERDFAARMNFDETRRFYYLYRRTSADLARVMTYSSEPELRRYLESLVARAYGQLHEGEGNRIKLRVFKWFFTDFPRTFRRHFAAFLLSCALFFGGSFFGGGALYFDPDAKAALMPFEHLMSSPSERVDAEQKVKKKDRLAGHKSTFSSYLIANNTRVSILTLVLGATWGIGTAMFLFSNGVMLGAVAIDYIRDGQSVFLAGWLLPHGSVEIPCILIAGQGGLLLAHAIIGHGNRLNLRARLRAVTGDLVVLIFGVAVMLVWAGIVEAFFSQYHEPVIPYWVKIFFGLAQLTVLTLFLSKAGGKDGAPS